ncbi:MAG: selenium cofactor biosynthesis protein YqeC [Thermincola sp.]|nr:selenium cofactor biosynthesis protein YqeC [Thermincola sp.]MDT3701830.1 selenium cofactor biosynthesis protein YqeC [Thermincola sp.]
MNLWDALNLSKNSIVSLVGGGGKTTTMFTLSREAKERGLKTVLATTTRIYCPEDQKLAVVATDSPDALFSGVRNKLSALSTVVAGAEIAPDNKLTGLDPQLVPGLLAAGADLVVVEADGAARKPFKAPADHEPVIPAASTVVIPVVGIDCLNKPLLPEYVHRPEIVAALSGLSLGEIVTPQVVARILTHPQGFRKGVPVNCRWIPLINKIETPQELAQAREVAALAGEIIPCRVIIGASAQAPPVIEVLDFNQF